MSDQRIMECWQQARSLSASLEIIIARVADNPNAPSAAHLLDLEHKAQALHDVIFEVRILRRMTP